MNKCYYSAIKREEEKKKKTKSSEVKKHTWPLHLVSNRHLRINVCKPESRYLTRKVPHPQPSSFQLMPSTGLPLLRWKTLTPSFLLHPTSVSNLSTQPSNFWIWNLPSTHHLYCCDLCPSQHHPLPALCNYHLPGLPLSVLASSSLLWTQ